MSFYSAPTISSSVTRCRSELLLFAIRPELPFNVCQRAPQLRQQLRRPQQLLAVTRFHAEALGSGNLLLNVRQQFQRVLAAVDLHAIDGHSPVGAD